MTEQSAPSPRTQIAEAISCVWWIVLMRGMLLLALGGYALFQPSMTLVALTQVMGIFVVVDGVAAILAGILGLTDSRGWTIARGALGIVIGGFVIGHSALVADITAMFIVFVLALHAIAGGLLEIIVAIQQRKLIQGEGWLIFSGVLAILFGMVLAAAPLVATNILIRIFGIYAMFFGVSMIAFSLRLRGLGKRLTM